MYLKSRVLNQIKADFPAANNDVRLKIAINKMSDTMQENGLHPSKLDFRIIPYLASRSVTWSGLARRMNINFSKIPLAMNSIVEECKLLATVYQNLP